MQTFENLEDNLHYKGVQDLDPQELNKQLKGDPQRKMIQLIDVRQPDEFTGELGHIPGAKLIVLDEIPDRLSEIFNDLQKDKATIFVCRSGGRSARASAFAKENGFTNIYNLKGGMLLWNELHFSTEV